MSSQAELLYPFGFLLGEDLKRVPDHFRRVEFPIPLYVNSNTHHAIRVASEACCFLTGTVVHPEHPDFDLAQIADLLCMKPESFQLEIDKLIGRFAFIMSTPSETLIQTDASGMRSIYFGRSQCETIVGSHARLVARALGKVEYSSVAKSRKLGCPGMDTPFHGVQRLPPNIYLEMRSGVLRRFFPADQIQSSNCVDSWAYAISQAQIAARHFAARGNLAASLTAGKDSRASLLALRDVWGSTGFFTYTRGVDSHDIDCAIAAQIAEKFSLQHRVINYADQQRDEDLLSLIKKNSFGAHQHGLALAYYYDEQLKNCLHVRSNMLEITRSNLYFAAKKSGRFPHGLTNARHLADYYALAGKLKRDEAQEISFHKYVEECELESALEYMSSWDLFFIEHRMGAWRTGIIEESDLAFDTTNLFNSREILSKFFGVPENERATSNALMKLVNGELPGMEKIAINPKKIAKLI